MDVPIRLKCLPQLQYSPSFSGTVQPVRSHEAERADDDVHNMTFLSIFRPRKGQLSTYVGLDHKRAIGHQIKRQDSHSLRDKCAGKSSVPATEISYDGSRCVILEFRDVVRDGVGWPRLNLATEADVVLLQRDTL